jgi:hypothetical protein
MVTGGRSGGIDTEQWWTGGKPTRGAAHGAAVHGAAACDAPVPGVAATGVAVIPAMGATTAVAVRARRLSLHVRCVLYGFSPIRGIPTTESVSTVVPGARGC